MGPKYNHKCPYKWKAERILYRRQKVMCSSKREIQICYENEGGGAEPRNAAPESGNVKEIHSFLGLLDEACYC